MSKLIHSWHGREVAILNREQGEYRYNGKVQSFAIRGPSVLAELVRSLERNSVLREELGNLRAVFDDEGLDVEFDLD